MQFKDITKELPQNYREYQETTLNFSNATNLKHIRLLKWFLNWATEENYNTNLEYKKFKFKFKGISTSDTQNNIIFFSLAEVKQLYNYNFSNNKRLDQIRDIFCFCCYTSLRYSDVQHLKKNDIKMDIEGSYYIEIMTVKTDNRIKIHLNKSAMAIIIKYKDIELKNNRMFPVPSNQKFNDYIKEVCKFAGFNSVETFTIYKGNERIETPFKKWELISSHTARRTFISNAIELEIPIDIIMSCTGHKDYKMLSVH